MPEPTTIAEWTVQKLDASLQRGDRLFVLDVRNRDEFERSTIEGVAPLPMRNVPYFEMLDLVEDDDLVGGLARYVEAHLAGELPNDRPILAVCAKGGTSRLVAQALDRLGYQVSNLSGGTAAWGDFYASRLAASDETVTVTQIARPGRGCLSYLVESDGRAAVVDPGRHPERYLELAAERSVAIEIVIDTHAHADHVSGGRDLATRLDVPYYLHPYDAIHPIDLLPARIPYAAIDERLVFTVGRARIEPWWIPGHTLGSVALLVHGRYLLAGDSIFVESIARPDLGGHAESWAALHYQSMQRLLSLPDETLVLPGHFSHRREANRQGIVGQTLGALRHGNDGLRHAVGDASSFARYIASSLPVFPSEYVDIKRINAGLLEVTDEQLAELETGKNQCAMGG